MRTAWLAGITLLAAAPALGRPARATPSHGSRATLAPLAAALAGADDAAAVKAATALGASNDPAAHDALLDALAFGLTSTVAVAALAALPAHPAAPDVEALRRYAHHRDPAVRSAALDALARYPDHAAQMAIVEALGDKVGTVRTAAADAAARAHILDAVAPLFALLDQGEDGAGRALAALADPDLARRIADHVGHAPDPAVAHCLGLVLRRADFPDPTRVEIVDVLGRLADPAGLAEITQYIATTPKKPARPSLDEAAKVVAGKGGAL